MIAKAHFISGLPRSGSTLLSALLKQNPQFHASVTSPVALLMTTVMNKMSGGKEFSVFFDDERRQAILRGIFAGYYTGAPSESVVFDTNRTWTARASILGALFPQCRIICCVRDVGAIMDSLERGGYGPVVLDLTGQGINITPLSSSNTFFDMSGDGRKHRTAWAGAGNGVLAFDADGNGLIDQRNEVVFTDWDPSATSDLQAIADVFDSNHNGKLDVGDAQFNSFKLLVTNADGTTTLQTLAQAGIASIDLTPNATKVVLSDGSTIDGQTIFTRTDGSTGTAATVSLTGETAGYVVSSTVTHNADGLTTIDNKGLNPDGSVANRTTQVTSADGKTRTLSFDYDGDGITDRTRTVATVKNADGSSTVTATNQSGNGTLVDKTIVTTSANGLSRTTQTDFTSDGVIDLTNTDVTVVNADSSRTETITSKAGNGTTVLFKSVQTISADRKTITINTDANGDGVNDSQESIVTQTNGTVVDTVSRFNPDATLREKVITTTSANGLSKTTQFDRNADTVFDLTTTDVITLNADGSRAETIRKSSISSRIQTAAICGTS